MVLSLDAWAGLRALFSALRAGVLSFASPKESSQRKGDPRLRGRLAPTPLCYSLPAGAAELGLRPQTVLALFPPASALLGAPHGDPKGVAGTGTVRQNECAHGSPKNLNVRRHRSNPDAFPGPLGGAEQRRNAGSLRRGLFEGQRPEFRSRPAFRVAQGTRAAGTDLGVAFSLATFFWRSKRKYARPQGGKQTPQSEPMPV
jgi:hypothetical protein